MSTFNTPFTDSITPTLDLECTAPAPSTLANHNNASQTKMYPGPPVNVSSPSQTNSQRVSKAMKGKRVHACQRPGCPKVFTRAEHRRRHELSHEPKKKYPCTSEGCKKAFHRPDYLAQHLGRHAAAAAKENVSYTRSDTSPRRSSLQQQMQPQAANSAPISFQADTVDNYSGVWGTHPSRATLSQTPQYPASGMPVEMVTAIDQYLRSILKPEAFSSPHQQMNPAIWGSDIDIDPTLTDPTFTKIESPDQLPLYSWPPTHHFQYEDHPVQMNHPSDNR
ncbi:hypothetical protein N7497_009853 [Penicillium chrysogenum]|nr:hypothetical protein N7497_009853 [Penicillium chrysogenum]